MIYKRDGACAMWRSQGPLTSCLGQRFLNRHVALCRVCVHALREYAPEPKEREPHWLVGCGMLLIIVIVEVYAWSR